MSNPKLNPKEESSAKKTRSPPKKAKVEQSVPKKKKLKTDAEKTAEKAQHLRFGKAELTPDELSRLSKAQKREMYAAHTARSAVHREIDQYEDDNVGTQALSEGEKAAGNVRDISKSRYARKLKKKAKMQGKKGAKTAKSSAQKPTAAQDVGASGEEQPKENKVTKIASGFLGVVVLIALAAGGIFYAFTKQKQKKQAEKEALDPDANYTEDKGDFEIPVEDEPEETDEEDTEPI